MTVPSHSPERHRRAGLVSALGANLTWAVQPLFWPLLLPTAPPELLAHRVVWAAVACVVAVLVLRRWASFLRVAGSSRQVRLLGAAGLCLGAAWGVYIHAVTSGQVVQGSLGLFMVPLSTVLAGVLVFRERLKPGQWAAVGLAVAATSVLTAAYGRPPWIALALCLLMAVYAVLKKLAAAPVLEGFTLECLAVLPLAVGFICWLAATGEVTVSQVSAGHTALAVCSGVMTTVPLLLHAASITSLPLFVVGVVQYLNPTVQFVLAVTVIGEQMTSARWWGFALVWVALAIFTASSLPHRRSPAATSPPPQSTVPRIVSPDPSKRS